jgi:hypothetical protein
MLYHPTTKQHMALSRLLLAALLIAGSLGPLAVVRATEMAWNIGAMTGGPVWSLAQNPTNGHSLYALGRKLARSRDAGRSWTAHPIPFALTPSVMAIGPGQKVLVGGAGGLAHSTDAGRTWQLAGLRGQLITALDRQGKEYFAGTTSGLYVANVGDLHWRSLGLTGQWVTGTVRLPSGETLVATHGGLFQSRQARTTWKHLGPHRPFASVEAFRRAESIALACSSSGYVYEITRARRLVRTGIIPGGGVDHCRPGPDPFHALAATTHGVYATESATGGHWRRLDSIPTAMFTDVLVMSTGVVYAVGAPGAFSLEDNTPTGGEWHHVEVPTGPVLSTVTAAPSLDRFVVGGSIWGGVSVSVDGGRAWTTSGLRYAPVLSAAVGGGSSPEILVGTATGLMRSQDAGSSWRTPSNAPADAVLGIAMDPDSDRAWAITFDHLYLSRDAGGSWRPSAFKDFGLAAIAFDSESDSLLLGGVYDGVWIMNVASGEVTRTAGPVGASSVSRIEIVGSRIFVETSQETYVSKDHGRRWDALPRAPRGGVVRLVAGDPNLPDRLFGHSGRQYVESVDGGVSWRMFSRGLPGEHGGSLARRAIDLVVVPGDSATVVAGTDGSGPIWRTTSA